MDRGPVGMNFKNHCICCLVMTQRFENGHLVIGITVVLAGYCYVVALLLL